MTIGSRSFPRMRESRYWVSAFAGTNGDTGSSAPAQERKKMARRGPSHFIDIVTMLVAAGRPDVCPRRLRRALRLRSIGIGQQCLLRSCDGGLRQHDHFRSDLHAIVQVDHVLIRETNAAARYVPAD